MTKIFQVIILLLLPGYSFAFFCPTNFSQINAGDTMDQVTATCGKPDQQTTKEEDVDNAPQEWVYLIPQTVPMNTNQNGQGTLKTTMDFDKDGHLINISVNGIGVGATSICNGQNVQLGEDRKTVQAACGQPAFVNKQSPYTVSSAEGGAPVAAAPTTKKITTFIYNTNPPAKLVFENGVLVTGS